MYHGNYNKSENERLSESLSDIERSISLCTLCEEEINLSSQTSSIFSASLSVIEETNDEHSTESENLKFAHEAEAIDCITKNCDEAQSKIISSYIDQQVFSTLDVTGENSSPLIKDHDVSKSFLELFQKSTKNSNQHFRKRTQQPLKQDNKERCLITNNDVSPKSNIIFKRDAGIEKFELFADKSIGIFGDKENHNDSRSTNDHAEKTSTRVIDAPGYEKKCYFRDRKIENLESREIYFSTISDDKEEKNKALTMKNDIVCTFSALQFPPVLVREDIDSAASKPDDNKDKSYDINGNEHLENDNEEIIVEAPRTYDSSIPDDEIPRKKAKMIEDELLPETLSISASPIIETKNFFQRKRIISSETKTHTDEAKEIPRKRPKIDDIAVNEFGDEEKATVIIIPKLRNIESKESEFMEMMDRSSTDSLEIPIASKLMMIRKFQVPRQLDVDGKVEINDCGKAAEKIDVPRFETEAVKLASNENNAFSMKKNALIGNSDSFKVDNASEFQDRHDDCQLTTKLALRENSVILQNTESTVVATERSKLAQLNTDANNDLAHIKISTKQPNKKMDVPKENESSKEKKKRRNSMDSWNEIENAFTPSKHQRSLPGRKNNKLTPVIANSPLEVKRLQNKITKQRQSMTNTLKNLRNLSSYMDLVRETVFAENDSDKEPLYRVVLDINEASLGPKSNTMVSTGIQTMMKNSSVERLKTIALDASTQTENAAINTRKKKQLEDENALQNCNSLVEKSPKPRKKKKLMDIDRATARAHQAIVNATFTEFQGKNRF